MGSIIVPKKSGGSIEPPQYTYREMPQAYKYYKDLREEDTDSAFLCLKYGACGFLYFGASSSTGNTTITVYGGSDGRTPLYKWASGTGWYHRQNGSWVLNATQPTSLTTCKTYEMDLDNYPLPRGALFEDLTGKSINDEIFGEQELITVIESGKSKPLLVNHSLYGASTNYGFIPVFAFCGGTEDFSSANNSSFPFLEFLDFTEGDTRISTYAFHNAPSLKYVKIPASVKTIGQNAFSDCTALERVEVEGAISSIGNSAFRNCYKLYEFDISSADAIGSYAFNSCYELRSVKFSSGLTTINDYAFTDCRSLTELVFPEGFETLGTYAFQNCTSVTKITFPSTLSTLGSRAFLGTSVTEINIPAIVTSLPSSVFQDCYSLTKVTLPNGLTSIDTNAFSGCRALHEINLPNTLTSINGNVFSGCTSLKEITIPSSITDLGAGMFNNCSSLIKINLPTRITSVGANLFSSCRSLTEIDLTQFPSLPSAALSNCVALRKLVIPANLTDIAANAFSGMAQCMYYKMMSSTPPSLANPNAFGTQSSWMKILVPYQAYDNYQSATNWGSSTYIIKTRQRGYGTFTAGTTLPTTVGTHTLYWYDLPTILNTVAGSKPTSGQITVAPTDGEYYCYYE